MNASLSAGKKEEISLVVPADLVHLKLELLLSASLVTLNVDERYKVLLVANGDRLSVRRPADVYVLT